MAQPNVARLPRRTVAMKAESTYATDAFAGTVVQADIVEAFNVEPNPSINMYEVPFLGGVLGGLGSIPGVRIGQVTFRVHMRGAGSAYGASVVPNVHNPIRACAYLATLVDGVSWQYTPRSTGHESYTIYIMQELGPTVKMTGCFGDVTFNFQVGMPGIAEFRFQGIYNTETDTPTLVTKAFSAAPQWPPLLGGAFQIGSENFAAKWANCQIASGNILDVQEDISATSGIGGVFCAGRRPVGTIDPEVTTRASFDWISKWENSTLMDMTFNSAGAAFVRYNVSAPAVQLINRGWASRGQKAVYQCQFALTPSNPAGDDELSILFN